MSTAVSFDELLAEVRRHDETIPGPKIGRFGPGWTPHPRRSFQQLVSTA